MQKQSGIRCATNLNRFSQDGIKYELQFSPKATDNLEYLGCGSLLRESFL